MSELKENPTQEEYDSNPEYFRDFERRLENSRQELLGMVYEAAGRNDLAYLTDQIVIIGGMQAQLKYACLTGEYPLWQKIEMFDRAVMDHDVMLEIDRILVGKRSLENV